MGTTDASGKLLARIACYAALAAIGALLVVRWLTAVHAALPARQHECLALDGEAMGRPAPGFALPDLDGKPVQLSSLRGNAVLLHFWFTQCPPCVAELPSLAALREALRGRGFALLTIAVDESADEVKRFLAQHDLAELPVLLDPERRVPAAYGTEKYPESYLIDGDGRVRFRFVNKRDWSSAEARACIGSSLPGR